MNDKELEQMAYAVASHTVTIVPITEQIFDLAGSIVLAHTEDEDSEGKEVEEAMASVAAYAENLIDAALTKLPKEFHSKAGSFGAYF